MTLGEASINLRLVNKVHEGRPHILDRIKEWRVHPTSSTPPRVVRPSRTQAGCAVAPAAQGFTTTLHAAFATCMAISVDATANRELGAGAARKVNNR